MRDDNRSPRFAADVDRFIHRRNQIRPFVAEMCFIYPAALRNHPGDRDELVGGSRALVAEAQPGG